MAAGAEDGSWSERAEDVMQYNTGSSESFSKLWPSRRPILIRATLPNLELAPFLTKEAFRTPRFPSVEEIASLQLPPLFCSTPAMLNPHYEEVKEECDAWIEAVAQPPTAAAASFLRACLLPRLVCLSLPQAILGPRFLHTIKMIAWLMICDDEDDNPEELGSDLSATAHRSRQVMAILHAQEDILVEGQGFLHFDGQVSIKRSAKLAALAELWQGIRHLMSPSLCSRFTSSMADYFEGLKMQATLRNKRCVPDVESYMEIRRQASFTIPVYLLLEYALDIELDKEQVENENIMELRNSAVDYISLCNDIYSCRKEISLGDYFNLPSIYYAWDTSNTFSLQNAMDNIAKKSLALEAYCNSLVTKIKAEYSRSNVPVAKAYNMHAYVIAITLGMAGTLKWFDETTRYKNTCTLSQVF